MVRAQPADGTTTTATTWLLVVWDGCDGDHTWLPPHDVETDPAPLDPSDPNAPAP